MKIITVNLPVNYLKAIDGLVGEKGLFPSRSELIRVAIRDFLVRELQTADTFEKLTFAVQIPNQRAQIPSKSPIQPEALFVRVPVSTHVDGSDDAPAFKTYRIIKK